ncbi:Cbwd1 [Symbiodinium sp. CCMP2456]|nr:Cbwd1 [Symbiodinium sp. CCMP2456]
MEALEMKDREAEQLRKVPVTILTGFLGSGKTTLLNFVLKARHGYKYAIIENEVGQIGIDNQLLKSANATAAHTTEQVVLLDNGCLCCTVRSDLVEAVNQILLKADAEAANAQAANGTTDAPAQKVLDGILIETTGLADPGPVCKTFYVEPDLRERTRVDCVLTVVDACHFLQQLSRSRSEDAVNESMQQVAFADKILLNKVDAASAASLQEVETTIRSINALCPILRCSLAKNPGELLLDELFTAQGFSLDRILERMSEKPGEGSWQLSTPVESSDGRRSKRAKTGGFLRASRHDAGVGSCSIALTGAPLVIQRFIEVMSALKNEHALDLYRYKGVVCVKEASGELKQAVLQGVHDMCEFEPRGDWPDGKEPLSQLVFIGRNLERDKWMRLFTFCQSGVLDDPEDRKGGTQA